MKKGYFIVFVISLFFVYFVYSSLQFFNKESHKKYSNIEYEQGGEGEVSQEQQENINENEELNSLLEFDEKAYNSRLKDFYEKGIDNGEYLPDTFLEYKEDIKKAALLVGADPDSYENVSGIYYKDKNDIFTYLGKVVGADYDSFEVIKKSRRAKDKNNHYYENNSLKGVDYDSFSIHENYDKIGFDDQNFFFGSHKIYSHSNVSKVLSDYCFLIDDIYIHCYNIFIGDLEEFYQNKILGPLIPVIDGIYKDDSTVYNLREFDADKIELTNDKEKFELLNDIYIKYDNKVYYSSPFINMSINEIKGADISSFKVYKKGNEEGYEFATDKYNVFLYGRVNDEYDVTNFNIESALLQKQEEINSRNKVN